MQNWALLASTGFSNRQMTAFRRSAAPQPAGTSLTTANDQRPLVAANQHNHLVQHRLRRRVTRSRR
ncbi:hypothetical protein KCP69_26335 [Salmonella enterica subsp. enterica]|nr:hypothetical protein KCP69_26335 [Salmonella enterica subsp. enterica]